MAAKDLEDVELAARRDVELGAECWLTQGWANTSSVDRRSSGSLRSKHRIRHLAREDIESGMLNAPRRILANSAVCS